MIKCKLTISVITSGDFGKVSVVVAFHLQIEHFAFRIGSFRNQMFVKERLGKMMEINLCIISVDK